MPDCSQTTPGRPTRVQSQRRPEETPSRLVITQPLPPHCAHCSVAMTAFAFGLYQASGSGRAPKLIANFRRRTAPRCALIEALIPEAVAVSAEDGDGGFASLPAAEILRSAAASGSGFHRARSGARH